MLPFFVCENVHNVGLNISNKWLFGFFNIIYCLNSLQSNQIMRQEGYDFGLLVTLEMECQVDPIALWDCCMHFAENTYHAQYIYIAHFRNSKPSSVRFQI